MTTVIMVLGPLATGTMWCPDLHSFGSGAVWLKSSDDGVANLQGEHANVLHLSGYSGNESCYENVFIGDKLFAIFGGGTSTGVSADSLP